MFIYIVWSGLSGFSLYTRLAGGIVRAEPVDGSVYDITFCPVSF